MPVVRCSDARANTQAVSVPGERYALSSPMLELVAVRLLATGDSLMTLFDGYTTFVPASVGGQDRFLHAVRFSSILDPCLPPRGAGGEATSAVVSIDVLSAQNGGDPDAVGSVVADQLSVTGLSTPVSFFLAVPVAPLSAAAACRGGGDPESLSALLTCEWWDRVALDWTSVGCEKRSTRRVGDSLFVECSCSHLTEFALIYAQGCNVALGQVCVRGRTQAV
jgi:hypothetical protein